MAGPGYLDSNIRNFLQTKQNKVQKFNAQSPNDSLSLMDEPTYLTFKLEFELEDDYSEMIIDEAAANKDGKSRFTGNIQGVVSPRSNYIVNGLLLDENRHVEAAANFLRRRNFHKQADAIKQFRKVTEYIEKYRPHFFQSISGLADVLRPMDFASGYRLPKDFKLTIETLESLDNLMSYWMNLYIFGTTDFEMHRNLLPKDKKRFKCKVTVTEIRDLYQFEQVMQSVDNELQNTNPEDQGKRKNEIVNKLVSINNLMTYYVFDFYKCTFDFSESFESYGSISNAEIGEPVAQKFSISTHNVHTFQQYGFWEWILQSDSNWGVPESEEYLRTQIEGFTKYFDLSMQLQENEIDLSNQNKLNVDSPSYNVEDLYGDTNDGLAKASKYIGLAKNLGIDYKPLNDIGGQIRGLENLISGGENAVKRAELLGQTIALGNVFGAADTASVILDSGGKPSAVNTNGKITGSSPYRSNITPAVPDWKNNYNNPELNFPTQLNDIDFIVPTTVTKITNLSFDSAPVLMKISDVSLKETSPVDKITEVSLNSAEPVTNITEISLEETKPVENITPVELSEGDKIENITPISLSETEPVDSITPIDLNETKPLDNITPVALNETDPLDKITPVELVETDPLDSITQIELEQQEPVTNITDIQLETNVPMNTITGIKIEESKPLEQITEISLDENKSTAQISGIKLEETAPIEQITEIKLEESTPVEQITDIELTTTESQTNIQEVVLEGTVSNPSITEIELTGTEPLNKITPIELTETKPLDKIVPERIEFTETIPVDKIVEINNSF